MVKLGKSSKRTPVRLRHKIEKASAAKQRKQRKQAKKNPEWRSKLKKDPGIPNLFPYKDKILHEIEERKRLKEEEVLRAREEASLRRQAKADGTTPNDEMVEDQDLSDNDLMDDGMDDGEEDSNPMAALVASAKARAEEYSERVGADNDEAMDMDDGDMEEDNLGFDDDQSYLHSRSKDGSRRAFDKVFKQVIEAADVVLYVLDARDPEGTRSKEVERDILAAEGGAKRLILILNKIDLVPPPVLKRWLSYLRKYLPTIPLKASSGVANAHGFDHQQLTAKATSETLFKALKSYAHNKQLKRSISVGVIGYPNVGKSSVINALTSRMSRGSSSACPVGAEAGITTNLRRVKLDSKLTIIDSPGIVFPGSNSTKTKATEEARLILLNAIPPKQISDPLPAVNLLIERLSTSETLFTKMLEFYGLPPLFPAADGKTNDFLIQVARKRGRLGKGGIPNINSAAMAVLMDWRDGRIQGWLEPPAQQGDSVSGRAGSDTKQIVAEWSKEFKLEGLWGDDEG